MSQVWSEINKVVNAIVPAADPFASNVNSDIINMENYKKCTFIIPTGTTSADAGVVTVKAGMDNTTGCATAISFKYRTQIASTGAHTLAGGDVPSALTDATTTGFAMTAAKSGGLYIIEVDASTVCAGTTAGAASDYDHVCLTVTESDSAGHPACVLAILSEPRYPQAILQTAID